MALGGTKTRKEAPSALCPEEEMIAKKMGAVPKPKTNNGEEGLGQADA